jgi:hypothetical protein
MLRLRFLAFLVLAAMFAVLFPWGFNAAVAAEADAESPAVPMPLPAPAYPDLYTISAQRIDATAGSAILARDVAMAQGRMDAWTKLYRRFTAAAQWGKQPQLADAQLLRLVRSFEVGGERRSTTRYLADVTYHFNPAAVRLVLRQANIPYTETRSKPALVIPIIDGKSFDAGNPWAMVWKEPAFLEGLVPLIPVMGDGEDQAVLSREDLLQLDWMAFEPLVAKYDAGEVVLAIASEDGNTLQVIEVTQTARQASAFGFAQSDFMADANAVADKVAESWKGRTSVDFGTRGRLTADVQFDSLAQWARIRAQLRAVRAVSNVDVVGIASNEAEISVSYFGRVEQLRDAMAQQSLVLSGPPQGYAIEFGRASAAAAP